MYLTNNISIEERQSSKCKKIVAGKITFGNSKQHRALAIRIAESLGLVSTLSELIHKEKSAEMQKRALIALGKAEPILNEENTKLVVMMFQAKETNPEIKYLIASILINYLNINGDREL